MRIFFLATIFLLASQNLFADKLILDSETKMVLGVTSRDNPEITEKQELVDVPDGTNIGGGPWKWNGNELEKPTKQDIETLKDVYDPKRVSLRFLLLSIDNLRKTNQTPEMVSFLDFLEEYLS